MPTTKPMLAVKASIEHIQPDDLISAKLDGIRGINVDGQMLTRSLKPLPNKHVSKVWSRADLAGIDGEFILGSPTAPDVYRTTNSALMRHEGTPEPTLYVFDDFTDPSLPYAARFDALHNRVHRLQQQGFNVTLLEQHVAGDAAARIEEEYLEAGYKGIIARASDAPYKFGRSTLRERKLLKVKRFAESEALVVGTVELMANENDPVLNELGCQARSTAKDGLVAAGTLGSLIVVDLHTGVQFNIGTGFTAKDRARIWHNRERVEGMVVTYGHFPIGVLTKPRFPAFKSFQGDL